MDFSEDHDLAAPRRQRVDRIGEQVGFFLRTDRGGGIGATLYDGQGRQIPYTFNRRHVIAPDQIDRHAARHLKKKRAGRPDRVRSARPPRAQERFLHDVIDIAHAGERAAQVGA